jgi:hypothetical protein
MYTQKTSGTKLDNIFMILELSIKNHASVPEDSKVAAAKFLEEIVRFWVKNPRFKVTTNLISVIRNI